MISILGYDSEIDTSMAVLQNNLIDAVSKQRESLKNGNKISLIHRVRTKELKGFRHLSKKGLEK